MCSSHFAQSHNIKGPLQNIAAATIMTNAKRTTVLALLLLLYAAFCKSTALFRISACGLPNPGDNIDPYVKVMVNGWQVAETEKKDHDNCPSWSTLIRVSNGRQATLALYDEDPSNNDDDFVGSATLDLVQFHYMKHYEKVELPFSGQGRIYVTRWCY